MTRERTTESVRPVGDSRDKLKGLRRLLYPRSDPSVTHLSYGYDPIRSFSCSGSTHLDIVKDLSCLLLFIHSVSSLLLRWDGQLWEIGLRRVVTMSDTTIYETEFRIETVSDTPIVTCSIV